MGRVTEIDRKRWLTTVRIPLGLFGLAFLVRLFLIALFPNPAYPDSFYYVEVAKSLATGHGLTVPFVWIFAEVGNRIPDVPMLPVPSNAHWLPLASFIEAPFLALFGVSGIVAALPLAVISATTAPLTYVIARDIHARRSVAIGAGILAAVPGAGAVFFGQPENFAILFPLVTAILWLTARGLRGDWRSFALAGLLAGISSLARNDGPLLLGALGLIWIGDRLRWWLTTHRILANAADRASPPGEEGPRRPIGFVAGFACVGLFLLVMAPWWLRQIAVFGSISPTSSSGAALWIRQISEWNSITAAPSLSRFLDQGIGPIVASRLGGLGSALANFVVVICSIFLAPFLVIGAWRRRRSLDLIPWFVYTAVVFIGATLLYPLHVPGGAFIHSAIGLAPYAYILSLEGVLACVTAIAKRRKTWNLPSAERFFMVATISVVICVAIVMGMATVSAWNASRAPRIQMAAEMERLDIPTSDRLFSTDAGGYAYLTGHPGVVTPNDPLPVIESVARAYDMRWLVLEREDIVDALAPVLAGKISAPWIGTPVFIVPSSDGGVPRLALYPVCLTSTDTRCASTVSP